MRFTAIGLLHRSIIDRSVTIHEVFIPNNKCQVPRLKNLGTEPPRTEGGTPYGAVALDERLTTTHPTSAGLGVSVGKTKEHPGPANDSDPGRVSPKPASATDAMSEYEPAFTTFGQTPTRLGRSVPLVEVFNRAVAVFSEAGQRPMGRLLAAYPDQNSRAFGGHLIVDP